MEAIDKKVIDELKGLMGDNIDSVFSAFIESCDFNMGELEQAIQNLNMVKIEQASHTMKGSSSNIGAGHFSNLCANIVDMARNKEEGGYDSLLGKLKGEYEKVLLEIKQIT